MPSPVVATKQMQDLLHDFFTLTGIRITYWQPERDLVISCDTTEDSPFCATVKSNPELCKKCRECDLEAIEKARQTKKPYTFVCHMGMREYAHPIIYDGNLLGILMIGQVRHHEESREETMEKLRTYESHGLNTEKLLEQYFQLPLVNDDKMMAATRMLNALACYTYLNGYVRMSVPTLVRLVEEYIDEHLDSRISIKDLCTQLYVSKSKLCQVVRKETGMTVIEWVNKKRIAKVSKYLESGKTFQEAAVLSGFNDVAYCSRVFRNIQGMSTTEFKKRICAEQCEKEQTQKP